MMEEKIDRIVQLDIDLDGYTDEELLDFGVEVVSLVEEPAIGVNFLAFSAEEFVKPRAGEAEDEFIGRCMSELKGEFPDEEQRLAVCYNYYEGEVEIELESYTDYPEAASNNAKRALKWAEENGWGSCGTQVGKVRANQLANREPISEETIARMSAFRRQQQNKNTPYGEGCGGLMWDAWGGDAGIDWAERKLKQIRKDKEMSCDLHFSEEQETVILEFCEANGTYLTKEDVIIDLNKKEFATITETVEAIRGLDLLKRIQVPDYEDAQVYYRYSGPSAERKFCKAMMNLSNAGKIFSEKEIDKMNSLNSQFAKHGQSSYSIFQFKGGKNCKHWWQKLMVFKGNMGQRIVIIPQPINNKQRTAATTWSNLQFSVDEEKKIITGPALIPNKMILRRNENGEPYYVFFSKDTVKKMAEKFFKLNKHNNTDKQHDWQITTKNTLLESWISEDKMYDKAYKMGFALPIGTWYLSYKINDEATWKEIKDGKIKGFSIAGGFIEKLASEKAHNQLLSNIKDILNNIDDE